MRIVGGRGTNGGKLLEPGIADELPNQFRLAITCLRGGCSMIASVTLINQILSGHRPMGVSISLMLVILQATVIIFGYLHLFTKNRKGMFSLLWGDFACSGP